MILALDKLKKMGKKGDVPSLLFVFAALIVVVLVIVLFNSMSNQFFGTLDNYFNNTEAYNETTVHETTRYIQSDENLSWDYGILIIIIGMFLGLLVSAFLTRTSPAFFWIYILLCLIILVFAVVVQSIWQSLAASPAFAEDAARFPISNALLGSYMPTFAMAIIMLTIILLFGKTPQESG